MIQVSQRIGAIFVQEIVLPFGFLNGIWISIGVNPKTEVLKTLSWIVEAFAPDSQFGLIFWLIPILTSILYVLASFLVGSWLGLIAVGLAFLAGLTILTIPLLGTLLFILAVVLGFFAPIMRDGRREERIY